MKTSIKILIPSFLIALILALACFGLLPKAQAVSPSPDGGYPGGNTAEGDNALLSLSSGGFNTAVGFFTLLSNTTASFNTALGAGTLFLNTADSNTAIGAGALLFNTVGFGNTANGAFALFSNTGGVTNAAHGYQALFSNTTGNQNTAIGTGALLGNTTGNGNTATGLGALAANTMGQANTATGLGALAANISGSGNTAIGDGALGINTIGHGNTALGDGAGSNVTTASNVISIGSMGANMDNSCFIGNIFGSTSSNGVAVLINSNGQLGTMTSSQRFKENIKPMGNASEVLYALTPVSFRYKRNIDPDGTLQSGLVAEDVEKVNRDLVVRDKEGKPYSVRYDQVNAMLLNEFLKEHKKVEALEGTVATLAATVREQAAQIQKVSAQLEVSKPAPQTVLNNQ
ncbi:MAG TPA: tail fiber domain-containing protein [Candidatus Udaeobacter sp.]|jgi:hypothetical protein